MISVRALPLLLAAFVAGACAANPLATKEQRDIDQLSIALYKTHQFDSLKQNARNQYIKTLKKYHVPITNQVNTDIDLAIDELLFNTIQKSANGDPGNPKLTWTDTAARTHDWFGLDVPGSRYSYDNPDCFYRVVPISDKYSYKLHGRRYNNGTADSSFSLISNPNSQGTVHAIYGKDIQVDDDGSYTITIDSSDSKSPNHLKSDWRVVQLFIRHNLGNWSKETPDELKIEVTKKPDPKEVKPFTNDTIIAATKKNLKESTFFYGFGALDFKTFSLPTNEVKTPQQSQWLGTLTSQAQSFGHYNLSDDEALVVTLTKGKADYFVVPACTVGLITTHPGKQQVSLNNYQSVQNKNGTYTYVYSKEDPGVHNWIDTSGRPQGVTMVRWQGLATSGNSDNGIRVHSQVVKLSQLSKVLPNDTKRVSSSERKRQLQKRLWDYNRLHYQ